MPPKCMSKRTVKPPGRYLHENIELAIDGNQAEDRKYYSHLHGGLLSLNAWKLSPTPRKIEMVTYTHSNEPGNRCPLEPAVHEVHKT